MEALRCMAVERHHLKAPKDEAPIARARANQSGSRRIFML
jgi:hypothetical protein